MSTATSTYDHQRAITRLHHREEQESKTHPLDAKLIWRVWQYTKPYTWLRGWLVVLVLIRSVQLPALTWVIAATIKGPIAAASTPGIIWATVGFFLLALSTQVVMHFRQRYALELGEAVVGDLRRDLFVHLQKMPLAYFYKTKLGRIISRMLSDVEDIRMGVQDVLFVSLVQLGQMLVAAAFMLWYDRTLFLMVLLLAPVLWGINHYFHRRLGDGLRKLRDSWSRVTATLAESVNGIRVTQGFAREDVNAEMFGALVQDHSRYNFAVARTQGLFLPLLDLNNQVFVAALLVVGGMQVLAPDSTTHVGDLVGFFFMAAMFFSPITILGNQYNQALTSMAGAERVFGLLDLEPEWSDAANATPLENMTGRVEFRQLGFEYLPGRPVLHDINLRVEPGTMVALVGQTGSGKTSIINLVGKFYLPTRGELLLDGREVRTITSESIHRQIATVLQQNFLFSGTVMENIRFGKPGASDEECRAAVEQLDCLDLIESLRDGFETQVGERGGNLSQGQRQLVCFARALISDPRILILDEATSSIDALTEARVQHSLEILLKGRTSFIIAHRLSTVREADLVLVLEQGRIVERGTHAELFGEGGHYAKLYKRFCQSAA